MNRSESIVNLTKALFKFQSNVSKIRKDANNPFFKSKYASLSHILNEIDDHLIDAGLVLIQPPVESINDNTVTVSTLILHAETGEFIESRFSMMPAKKDPQGFGSCISYMRRYAITSILKLNVDDDDGNEASNAKPKAEQPKQHQAKQELKSDFGVIKERMDLSQSMVELTSLGFDINNTASLTEEERKILRNVYRVNQERLKKVA